MTRLILREVARWGRALGAPLAVLAIAVVAATLARSDTAPHATEPALAALGLRAAVASLAWLLSSAVGAALQPARDRRAAEHLQELRDRAAERDTRLLCVERSLWQSPAGQRLVASDVQAGTIVDVWLAESALPAGAFALVTARQSTTLVDWISPLDVAAARRAERNEADRQRVRAARTHKRAAHHEQKAAAEVVRAAEALLDGRRA